MDIERLRAFLAVAELGHFSRAADRLNITQPGLTKRIRALEAQLGGSLFEREKQPIRITALGDVLLSHARRLVAEADAFLIAARRAVVGETGTLNLGFGLSTITLAPALIARFRAAYPGVSVTMDDFSSREQLDRLASDALDLGFVRLPAPAAFASKTLATDHLALVSPLDRPPPLAGGGKPQLDGTPVIALREERGPGLASQIRDYCRATSSTLRVVQEADDLQTVLALVAAGLGSAVVPASSKVLFPGRVRYLELRGGTAEWSVGAVWKRDRVKGPLANLVALLGEETQ